ncbi:branched-chain amino acid ABC transporter permease [Deinococcus sp. SDU3-2]|uniref:Branched-chain amino acid ABC transporter permease n=1 Tax=Deinococcus terrestris TaxID=2651870 RepID=A0A7X1NUN5_9DEIO|nr:branched-chain amino acid ABC transporter permease [Deinococcus terrestris]MPY65684.1 branched-chain amino acid ABC transporter permease [Deinococcus terrestris]
MTAANPMAPRRAAPAPDRTGLLLLIFVVTSALLLVSHNRDLLDTLGGLGAVLRNPIVEAIVVSLFLANVLFAYLWRAAPWAKALVGLGSLLLILPWAGQEDTSLLDLSIQIMIFAALALGLNIVVGLAGLLDLGYVAFFAVGAYTWGIFASPRFAEIGRYFAENPGASAAATAVLGAVTLLAGLGGYLALQRRRADDLSGAGAWGLVLLLVAGWVAWFFAGRGLFTLGDRPWSTAALWIGLVPTGLGLLYLAYSESRGRDARGALLSLSRVLLALAGVVGMVLVARSILLLTADGITGLTTGIDPSFFWLFLALSVFAAAVVGVLIGLPVLRLKGDYLAIITLGLGEVIRVLANNLDLYSAGSQGITPIKSASVGWFDTLAARLGFAEDQYGLLFLYVLCLLMVALILLVNVRLDRSRIGRAWIAIRDDEVAAQAMGVPLVQTKLIAFATGASFAGVMGMIFAAKQTFVSPESFNLFQSIGVLAMVILGGMGSFPGVILGATVVTLLNLRILPGLGEATAGLSWIPQQANPGQLQRLIFGAILVAMMLLRPEGLLPSRRRTLELHHEDNQEDDSAKGTGPALTGGGGDVFSPGLETRKEDEPAGGAK